MGLFDTGKLCAWCAREGIELDGEMLGRFSTYADFLVEYNERVNLTAITDPDGIAAKHFLDSLLLLRAVEIPQGARFIDIGSGAGFPGVPVKIVRGDISLTLLDSLQKRVLFLQALSGRLTLDFDALHQRAEEGARGPALREQFDVAASRAVAALPALCEYCLPFVKPGGVFAALKSRGAPEEAEMARHAISELGGRLEGIKNYHLPDSSERSILIVKKISHTPSKYPRVSAKIAKNPL